MTTQKLGFFQKLFGACYTPVVDADHQRGIEMEFENDPVLSTYVTRYPNAPKTDIDFKSTDPHRMLQLPGKQYSQPAEPYVPRTLPNKFQHRRYVETDTTYQDVTEEMRKKECYKEFIQYKMKHPEAWNKNFEQIYSQVPVSDSRWRQTFQKLMEKGQDYLY